MIEPEGARSGRAEVKNWTSSSVFKGMREGKWG
jgi:hypothetical protein